MPDQQPLVSVIVTNYNNSTYLRKCLLSIMSQTLSDIEVIVVDDGSTDDSRTIIEKMAAADDRVKPFFRINGGFGSAANSGLDAAIGKYVAFVDSDDYLAPDMYQVLSEAAEENQLDLVRGDHFNISGEGTNCNSELFSATAPVMYGKVICPRDEVAKALRGGVDIFAAFGYIWDCVYNRSFLVRNNIRVNEGVSSHNDIGFYFQTIALAERMQYVRVANYYHRTDNMNQSMRDEEKLFRNFFIEHEFIENRFHELGLWDDFKHLVFRREYSNYVTVLDRLPIDRILPYAELASAALRSHADEFKYDTFLPWQRTMANLLATDPRLFLNRWYNQRYPVSVIIPVYNGEKTLRDTLESVCSQSLAQLEIIIVDDGSTDSTPGIIQQFAYNDSRIVSIRQKNQGAGVARNTGTQLAHGQYLYYLDADDVIDHSCLQKALSAARANNADLLLFEAKTEDAAGKIAPLRFALKSELLPHKQVFSLKDFTENPFLAVVGWPWDKLVRREFVLVESLKFDNLNVSNDGTFVYLALCCAPRISVLHEELVTHRTQINGSVSSRHDLYPLDSWHFLENLYDRLYERGLLSKVNLRQWFQNYCLHRIEWVHDRLTNKDSIQQWFDHSPEAFEHLELSSISLLEVDSSRASALALVQRMQLMLIYGQDAANQFCAAQSRASTADSTQSSQAVAVVRGQVVQPSVTHAPNQGRIVFTCDPSPNTQWGVPLLEINAMSSPWSSTYALLNVAVLTNHTEMPVGSIKLAVTSIPSKDNANESELTLDEFSITSSSDPLIVNSFALVIHGLSVQIWGRFTERYSGLAWTLATLDSRDQLIPEWSPMASSGLTSEVLPIPSNAVSPSRPKEHGRPGSTRIISSVVVPVIEPADRQPGTRNVSTTQQRTLRTKDQLVRTRSQPSNL